MNKNILLLIWVALLSSCSQMSQSRDEAKELGLQKLKAALEKVLLQGSPIDPPAKNTYPLVKNIPRSPFVARNTIRSLFTYDS